MDGNRKCDSRKLRRCYQCNRLEEQLLAMAYGEVWPLIRNVRAVRQPPNSASPRRSGFVSKQKIGA